MSEHEHTKLSAADVGTMQRDELLKELTQIAQKLDDLPDDAYAARIDLRERQREIRTVLRAAGHELTDARYGDDGLDDEDVIDLRELDPELDVHVDDRGDDVIDVTTDDEHARGREEAMLRQMRA